jgi:hypothetical protein
MSEAIEFAAFAARNVLIAFGILLLLGLVVLFGGAVFIVLRNTVRHVRNRNVRAAVQFSMKAAETTSNGNVHSRGGVFLEAVLAFVTYRENRLLSIRTDYSERIDDYVYTTIEA